jgi:predicted small integral membrane protein
MALRVSKAVLVFAIALFYTILVLNNITDYGSNYEFVRHVLLMDSTFPRNHGMWRRQFAASTYGLLYRHHRLGISNYASMLVGWCSAAEIVSCGQGAIRRRAERRRDCADDEPADVVGGIP